MQAQSEIRSYIDGKKRPGTAAALTSQSDKLVSLFGQILEELGSIKAGEGLVDECLMHLCDTFVSDCEALIVFKPEVPMTDVC